VREEARNAEKPAMPRILTLHLDEFGRKALAEHGRLRRCSAASALSAAARHYLADREAGRIGWLMPRFRRFGDVRRGARVDVSLDDQLWWALEAEAALQGVTTAQLGEHAALYFLADLDR
jgi:hypothetical protein